MSQISEKKVDLRMNNKKKGRNKPSKKEAMYTMKVEITIVQCPFCQSWKTSKCGRNITTFKGERKRIKCNECGHSFYVSPNAHVIDKSQTVNLRNDLRESLPENSDLRKEAA